MRTNVDSCCVFVLLIGFALTRVAFAQPSCGLTNADWRAVWLSGNASGAATFAGLVASDLSSARSPLEKEAFLAKLVGLPLASQNPKANPEFLRVQHEAIRRLIDDDALSQSRMLCLALAEYARDIDSAIAARYAMQGRKYDVWRQGGAHMGGGFTRRDDYMVALVIGSKSRNVRFREVIENIAKNSRTNAAGFVSFIHNVERKRGYTNDVMRAYFRRQLGEQSRTLLAAPIKTLP